MFAKFKRHLQPSRIQTTLQQLWNPSQWECHARSDYLSANGRKINQVNYQTGLKFGRRRMEVYACGGVWSTPYVCLCIASLISPSCHCASISTSDAGRAEKASLTARLVRLNRTRQREALPWHRWHDACHPSAVSLPFSGVALGVGPSPYFSPTPPSRDVMRCRNIYEMTWQQLI